MREGEKMEEIERNEVRGREETDRGKKEGRDRE